MSTMIVMSFLIEDMDDLTYRKFIEFVSSGVIRKMIVKSSKAKSK
jgi:hypothetical protein